MCRSNADGTGRRCNCDSSEKRLLRRRNREAIQSVTLAPERPPAPRPGPRPGPPAAQQVDPATPISITGTPTDEECREQVRTVHELRDEWRTLTETEELGRYSIPARKKMKEIERETRRLGAMVSTVVEAETGKTDAEYVQEWEDKVENLRKTVGDSALLQPAASTDGVLAREYLVKRGDQLRSVMSRIRPLGGDMRVMMTEHNEGKLADMHAEMVSYLPSEWVERSNEAPPIEVETAYISGGQDGFYVRGESIALNKEYVPSPPEDYWWADQGAEAEDNGHYEFQETISKSTLLHETVHHMEYVNRTTGDGSIIEAEAAFIKRRTTHDGVRDEEETFRSDADFKIRPDSFADRYMGREYDGNSFEVLTVGAESVFRGKNGGFMGLLNSRPDPDTKHFVIGSWLTL